MRRGVGLMVAMAVAGWGCSDSPTDVQEQVIEEVEFASSLGINLDDMRRLATGVYIQDLVIGTGEPAVFGTQITIHYQGWLTDGTQFVSREFDFPMGQDRVPLGLEDGVLNLRVGGTRRIIVPPRRGYGGIPQIGEGGTEIPGGSVLIYEVELLEVVEIPG